MKKKIFIVEKEQKIKKLLKDCFDKGDIFFSFISFEEILPKLSQHPDLIVLSYDDYVLDLIKKITGYDSSFRVVVFSKNYDVEKAVGAVKAGAYAYLNYSDSPEKIKEVLEEVFKEEELGIIEYVKESPLYFGKSHSAREFLNSLNKVIYSNLDIILLGEIGSGKQSIAKIIHEVKNKKKKPFAFINFSKYEQEYWEQYFWSSFKDYFQEYDTDVPNLREPIYGTIYLKNLESEDDNFRISLFQMLRKRKEEKQSKFMGDIRVIIGLRDEKSLSNVNLENFHVIRVPSLMERKEEIIDLARIFLKRFSAKYNRRVEEISLNVLDFLTNYSWPGNIEELEVLIRAAVLKSKKSRIDIEDLWLNIDMFNNWVLNAELNYKNSIMQAVLNYEGNLIKTFLKKFEDYKTVSKLFGIDEMELEKKVREITTF